MEEEYSAEAEGTAEVSQPETTEESESTPQEGQPDGAPQQPVEEEPKKSRASERITSLIAKHKREMAEKEAELARYRGNQLEGVTDEGIDPLAYGQGIARQAESVARKAARTEAEMIEVSRDPLIRDNEVAQLQVSALINQGFAPLEAFEIYKEQLGEIEKQIAQRNQKRQQASSQSRLGTSVPSAGRSKGSDSYSETELARMVGTPEYEKHRVEILREAGVEGI